MVLFGFVHRIHTRVHPVRYIALKSNSRALKWNNNQRFKLNFPFCLDSHYSLFGNSQQGLKAEVNQQITSRWTKINRLFAFFRISSWRALENPYLKPWFTAQCLFFFLLLSLIPCCYCLILIFFYSIQQQMNIKSKIIVYVEF